MQTQHPLYTIRRALTVASLLMGVLGLLTLPLVQYRVARRPTGIYHIGSYDVVAMNVPIPECSRDTRCPLADYTVWVISAPASHMVAPNYDVPKLKLRLVRLHRPQLH
jgi:hypothetical protein